MERPLPESATEARELRPEFYIPLTRPIVSRIMIGVNLLVFAATFLFGLIVFGVWTGPVDLRILYLFGMKSNLDILQGEWWRLFTAMFIHIGPTHLISNLIGLFWLGPLIEGHLGHLRFALIYILGGLLGSIASYAFTPALSAGASGAVFALLGGTALYFYRFRENLGRQGQAVLQSAMVVLALNLFLGVSMSGVDNWGHLGGLAGGLLLTWGLIPRYQIPAVVQPGRQPLTRVRRPAAEIAWILFSVAVLGGAFWLATLLGPPLN